MAGSSLTGQALTLRNGRRHSLLGRHLAVQLGRRGSRVEGRATGHAHFARLRSNLLRLDTTATRTRQAAASDDRHRAKKKNVPPRVTVDFADFPECFSALPSRGKTSPRHITHHVRIRIYITHRNSERAPLNCLCDLRSPLAVRSGLLFSCSSAVDGALLLLLAVFCVVSDKRKSSLETAPAPNPPAPDPPVTAPRATKKNKSNAYIHILNINQ